MYMKKQSINVHKGTKHYVNGVLPRTHYDLDVMRLYLCITVSV